LKRAFKFDLAAAFLLLGMCALNALLVLGADYKIVCYFTNWAVKRPGLGSFLPEHVDPCLCTHVIYSFSEMKDNKLYPMEKYDHADGDKPGFFERFNNLKFKNPKLKTLIAVGGWVN
jgi:GH18 family chitinase